MDKCIKLSLQPNAILLSALGRSAFINLPLLHVEEGILNESNCLELAERSSVGQLAVSLRWNIRGRIYRGDVAITSCGAGACWQCQIAPEDGLEWKMYRSVEGSGELTGWTDTDQVSMFHGDNIRGASQNVPLMEGSYWVLISDWKRPLNSGRWQSFPGMWLKETGQKCGFVYGVLTQAVWKHTMSGKNVSPSRLRLDGSMAPPGIDAKRFAEGERYAGEILYFEWVEADTPSQAFSGYLDALCEKLSPCKSLSPLARATSWGSWNDRKPNFWDVSEELIQRTVKVLKERFPAVRALQIDDGYADGGLYEITADYWAKLEHGLNPDEDAKLLCPRRLGAAFFYEPAHAVARDRFPNGMRAVRNRIADDGFIPGIWLGLNLVSNASLAQDHPEWMVYAEPWPDADPELYTVFGDTESQGLCVLDPSVPEVRNYLDRVVKLLFDDWGFESLKLDFWSYAFENNSFRLKSDEKTAYEWRGWLFSLFRSRLAPTSFLTMACDISTGNPFLSAWVDNVRYGIDIGNGRWENIKYTALTGTFLLHVQAYRFCILNSDSIGLLERLSENERMVFWAWAAVTRSVCELAGDLALQPREKLRSLQKLLLSPKNGEPAFIGENHHLSKNEPASVVWTRGDLFSEVADNSRLPDIVMAVFNWGDVEQKIFIDTNAMGAIESQTVDVEFFQEECVFRDRSQWEITLAPRSARLSHISFLSALEPRVLASSWKVEHFSWKDGDWDMRMKGDAASGILVFWPLDGPPILDSSLPANMQFLQRQVMRITPILSIDQIHDWRLRISPGGCEKLKPGVRKTYSTANE